MKQKISKRISENVSRRIFQLVKQGNLTIVGSNMIDLTSFLNRFPKKGETVYGRDFQQGFGGKGSNQGVIASLLGANVSMITTVGDDAYGREWLSHYQNEKINTDFVKVVEDMNSGTAAIWVEEDGDNRIVITPGANEALDTEFVSQAFETLPQADIVLSQLENPQQAILEGFKRGKESGAITLLNPAPADVLLDDILEYTDWLLPNETEFAFLTGEKHDLPITQLIVAIKAFATQTNTNLVVTVGKNGALLYRPKIDKDVHHIETTQVAVKDSTGAGDAFCGTFAYGLSIGLNPRVAIELANAIASDSVQKLGTQTSYAREQDLEKIVSGILRKE